MLAPIPRGGEGSSKQKLFPPPAWPKGTSPQALRPVRKGRHKGSLRWPKMPWQGLLAFLQPPKPKGWLAGLALGKWQLLAVTAGKACLVACLANAHLNPSTGL